ncbi:uncharacterized protein N7458_000300 [Penicillium daleae]|uniref:Uncharacterized protein n=1 Tax=Penicillium daleae TaxID=63821 RepID=A0AAD6CFN2_9EURO|nr:uncharacterized protein N7458_000300 [Penicillium daleae]KAJ5464614.1 hypothetical protein N7458_000300 [Penicillium daleae]
MPSGALEEWQEIQTGLSSAEHSETDPSNAPSVFSLATLPSTTMTTDTRLTVDEMQTAIEELVSIFFDDTQMAALYERVLLEREVPLERFVRNFRRLIKRFAMDLQEEAREAIDLDLAQLISARARLISDKIGNKLELKYFNETQPQRHILPNPNLIIRVKYQHSMLDDIHESSSDEDDERPERITALVSHGRSFILESAAFDNLRLELRKFVIPNGLEEKPGINIQGGMFEILRGIFLWYAHAWGLPSIDWATRRAGFWARCVEGYRYWKKLLQFFLGEEDIPEKHKRFRWINRHGKRLYDDYVEHEPGALHVLQEYLQATTMPNSPVGDGSQSQGISSAAVRYTPGSSGLQARASTSTTSSGDITDQSIATPTSQPAVASQGIGTGNRASRPLLLLSCIERRGRPTTLHQEYVTDITDDRQLFHTLRKIYYSHRRKFESFWSLRTLHSIHFMKFLYADTNYIDIRCHPEICIPGQPCSCIPPATLVPPLGSTYQCRPIPSKHSPPIGPRLMMDFFADPDSRVPGSDLVMQQLPKKLDTELTSDGIEVTEAWGIFYREEWNWRRIWGTLGFAFFPPSLLFGVLWGILRKDIQGAFGVASWWMAGATIFIGIVGTSV